MISPDAFDYMSALAEDLTNDRDAWRARAEQAEARLAKVEALCVEFESRAEQFPDVREKALGYAAWRLRAALAPPEDSQR